MSLRLRRICSSEEFFEKRARELHNILLERGYKDKLIRKSIDKARQLTSEEALRLNIEKRNTERVPLVVKYNPALLGLRKIIAGHQNVLTTSQRCKGIFSKPPLIAYRKGRNLQKLLTSKRLKQPYTMISLQTPPIPLIQPAIFANAHFRPIQTLRSTFHTDAKSHKLTQTPNLVIKIQDAHAAVNMASLQRNNKRSKW